MRTRFTRSRKQETRRVHTRQTALAAALAALALGASACGGGVGVRDEGGGGGSQTKSGPLTIGVVPKTLGFSFWNTVHKGAECAAKKAKGKVTIDWTGTTAETDVSGQIDILRNLLTRQVDGLVYAATDAKALTQVSKEAINQGTPVANIDSGTDPQPDQVPLYATDNEAAAVRAADLMAEHLGSGDHQIAIIQFQAGTQTNTQRVNGFKQGLKKHPNLELVDVQSSDSDVTKARRVTADILTANPKLDGIFAANEPSVIGAVQAVEAAGKSGDITMIGWDAAEDEIAALKDGKISALVVQNPFKMGYLGVQNIVAHIRSGKKLQSADTGVTMVTQDNLQSDKVQAVLNPSCANPPVN